MDIKIKNITMDELLTLARLIGAEQKIEVGNIIEEPKADIEHAEPTITLLPDLFLEGVSVDYKNFEGREERYNPKGNRNFYMLLSEEKAYELIDKGYPVKTCGKSKYYMRVCVTDDSVIEVHGEILSPNEFGKLDRLNITDMIATLHPYSIVYNNTNLTKMYLSKAYVHLEKEDRSSYIDSNAVAELLDCTRGTVTWYTRNKNLPFRKIGVRLYFDKEEVLEWDRTVGKKIRKGSYKRTDKVKKPVSDYSLWRKTKAAEIKEAGLDEGKTMSMVFKAMTKDYGVVWDQVKRDFFKANGYPARSTLQACYWYCNNSDTSNRTERLFDDCLSTYLRENRRVY